MDDLSIAAMDQDTRAKAYAALTAQVALAGHAVHKTDDGAFIVTRSGSCRHCKHLEALQALALQLGVPKQ